MPKRKLWEGTLYDCMLLICQILEKVTADITVTAANTKPFGQNQVIHERRQ